MIRHIIINAKLKNTSNNEQLLNVASSMRSTHSASLSVFKDPCGRGTLKDNSMCELIDKSWNSSVWGAAVQRDFFRLPRNAENYRI